MNKERIKTLILTVLVLMSMVFTIQLWVDMPFERISSFSSIPEGQDSEKNYNLSNFVLPRWIMVNFGGDSHTKLFRSADMHRYYSEIYGEVLNIVKCFSQDGQQAVLTRASEEEWSYARSSKSLELEFERPLIVPLIQGFFLTEPNLDLSTLTSVKSIIVTTGIDGHIFMKDGTQDIVYKVPLPTTSNRLVQLIDELEEKDPVKYWSLAKDIHYTDNYDVYLPLKMSSINLPVGTAEQEMDIFDQQAVEMYASSFFKDMSIVRKITETSGSVIFTDGSSALKIYTNGYVEYIKYSTSGSDRDLTDPNEALNTALNFIDNHGGIPEQLYLREVTVIKENQQRGYVFKFNYCYDGLPFVFGGGDDFSAIEVSVFNNSVVSYKRLINRIIRFSLVQESLLNPIEAFNVMFIEGYYGSEETRIELLDMYLGYYITPEDEKEYEAVPVWYIKGKDSIYIIDAYQGKVLN